MFEDILLYHTSQESLIHFSGSAFSFFIGILVPWILTSEQDYITIGSAFLVYAVAMTVEFMLIEQKNTRLGRLLLLGIRLCSVGMLVMSILLIILKEQIAPAKTACLIIAIICLVIQFLDTIMHTLIKEEQKSYFSGVSEKEQAEILSAFVNRAKGGQLGEVGGKKQ